MMHQFAPRPPAFLSKKTKSEPGHSGIFLSSSEEDFGSILELYIIHAFIIFIFFQHHKVHNQNMIFIKIVISKIKTKWKVNFFEKSKDTVQCSFWFWVEWLFDGKLWRIWTLRHSYSLRKKFFWRFFYLNR